MPSVPFSDRVSAEPWRLTMRRTRDDPDGAGGSGLYAWMLKEDFDHLQYGHEISLSYRGVETQRGNELVSDLLLEIDPYDRSSADQMFPNLVSMVAVDHLTYGRSFFEVYLDSSSDNPRVRLGVLPGWSLRVRGGNLYQEVPTEDKFEWKHIPESVLVPFLLPGRLGKELNEARRRLTSMAPYDLGQNTSLLSSARRTGYEFAAHKRAMDQIAASVTREIGWSGRDLFMDRATNSYRIYRRLRFMRTWLIIVSACATTLSEVCGKFALEEDESIQIEIGGLPSIDRVDEAMTNVIAGTESLDRIYKTVLNTRYS